jgi:VWFA-related protein
VLVPVVVTDQHGDHVPGLTRDDFELKQDGKDQKIASFEEITSESTPVQYGNLPPRAFTNQAITQHPKKLEIVVLDLWNTSLLKQGQARGGLIEILSKSAGEDALIALVVLQRNGIHLIHNFTSDRSVLMAALGKVQASASARDTPILNAGDGDEITAEAILLQALLAGGGDIPVTIAQAKAGIVAAQAKLDASRESQAGLTTLECFQQLARYFASVTGRKSLIWASTSFNYSTGSMTGELTRGATPDDWQRAVRMFQEANVAVYPVDVGGLVAPAGGLANSPLAMPMGVGSIPSRTATLEAVSAGRLHDAIEAKHETMRTIAGMMGGREYYNNNNIGERFRHVADESGKYYMLTYYTTNSGKTGWHKIDVKVHQDKVQVRSRDGFFLTRDMQNPEATRQADESMAVTSALSFTALPISGMWQQIEPAGDKRKVHFSLFIPPGATAIDADHDNHIKVDFLGIARDLKGKDVATFSQQLDKKLPSAGASQIEASGLTYVNTLTIPPGQYNVSIVVRDNLTGKIGSVVAPLRVD